MLPEQTQNIYRERAKKQLEQYQRELAEWESKLVLTFSHLLLIQKTDQRPPCLVASLAESRWLIWLVLWCTLHDYIFHLLSW